MGKNAAENIGLCRRAGKITVGFDAVVKEMTARRGKKSSVAGIITASDISEKTLKEIRYEAGKRGHTVTVLDITMGEIENVLKKRVGIIGILDEGLFKLF